MFDRLKQLLFPPEMEAEVLDPQRAFVDGKEELREFDWGWPFSIEDEDLRRQMAYDYALQVLKTDMFGSSVVSAYRIAPNNIKREWTQNTFPIPPMPDGFVPEEIKGMPFGKNTVLACAPPGENVFFPELGLMVLYDDNVYQLEYAGKADVKLYPLELCFPYYYTDGFSWVDTRSKQQKPVYDISFALLYDTAQIRWSIQAKKPLVTTFPLAKVDMSQRENTQGSEVAFVLQSGVGEDVAADYIPLEISAYRRIAAILRESSQSGNTEVCKYCTQTIRFLLRCANTELPPKSDLEVDECEEQRLICLQQALDEHDYVQVCAELAGVLEQGNPLSAPMCEQILWMLDSDPSSQEFFPWDDLNPEQLGI